VSELAATTRTFRSSLWRGFALCWVVFLVIILQDLARHDFFSNYVALAWLAFLSTWVWCTSWRPQVTFDFERVEVRNPLRTARVPWNTITRIDATDSLRLHTKERIVRSWAVTRSGAVASLLRSARTPASSAQGGPAQAAMYQLARRSPVDYAVEVLRDTWEERRTSTKGQLEVRWAMPEIVAILVTAVLVVVATVVS
jgi:hypothetical protein